MRAPRMLAVLLLGAALLTVPAAPAAAEDVVRAEAESLTGAVGHRPGRGAVELLRGRLVGGAPAVAAGRPGGGLGTVSLPSVPAGQYDIGAVLTRAADYGTLRFAVDGVAVGQLFDGYAPTVRRVEAVPLGSASLAAGSHRLTVTVTGRSAVLDRLLRWPGHAHPAPRRPAGGRSPPRPTRRWARRRRAGR